MNTGPESHRRPPHPGPLRPEGGEGTWRNRPFQDRQPRVFQLGHTPPPPPRPSPPLGAERPGEVGVSPGSLFRAPGIKLRRPPEHASSATLADALFAIKHH